LDIDNKLHNYLKITGILNNVFKPQKTLKETRLKLYNTLALPVLLYGSESWTIKARDARRITAAEMKVLSLVIKLPMDGTDVPKRVGMVKHHTCMYVCNLCLDWVLQMSSNEPCYLLFKI